MRIGINGSHGFIGDHLFKYFTEKKIEVVRLPREIFDSSSLENFDVIINLAGENIFGPWTPAKKKEIWKSRIETTLNLVSKIKELKSPPQLLISASAVGYYGNKGEKRVVEEDYPGEGFLADLCIEWEKIARGVEDRGIRCAITRFGIILGSEGGALKRLGPIFKMGLGGRLGSGDQFMSWIAIEDLASAIDYIIQTPSLLGPINMTSPNAVANAEFTRLIGKTLKKPTHLPFPSFLLRFILGDDAAKIYLDSAFVIPKKLEESGFKFKYLDLEEVLKKELE